MLNAIKNINSICFFLFFVFQISCFAQIDTNIITIEKHLLKETSDTSRVNIMLKLAEKYSTIDIKKSEEYAHQALDISSKINYKKGIAYSNYQIAKIFRDSDFDLAEVFIIESMKLAHETNDSLLIARIYTLMGSIKCNKWEYEEAYKYFSMALRIFSRFHDYSSVADSYNNFGVVFIAMDKNKLAITCFSKAIEMNKKFNNKEGLAVSYLNISEGYATIGLYDSSLTYLNKSLGIAKDNNIIRIMPWIYNSFSREYLRIKDYKNANQFSFLAIDFARKTNNHYQLLMAYQCLKDLFREMHKMDSAFFYSEKSYAIQDSIKIHERTNKMDILEISYKYQEEMKFNRLNHKKQQITLLLIIALLIIMIGIVTTFFLLQKLKIRKKQLENERLKREKLVLQNEIAMKSREVTYKMLHITNQNQLINKVIDKLTTIEDQPDAENRNVFNKIISELKLNQMLDIWDAFEKEFTLLHPNFFNNLLSDYPNLTQYEKRLCAFLKLNMNSKEIADILHLNYESIIKARTRLRKKLNLTGTDENLNSVLSKY